MTGIKHIMTLHVRSMVERKLKEFIFDETSLQICSTDEEESKGIIVDECSTKEDKS